MESTLTLFPSIAIFLAVFPASIVAAAGNVGIMQLVGIGEYPCSRAGYFPHSNNRQRFYQCQVDPADRTKFQSLTHECSADRCFDDVNPFEKCTAVACTRTDYTCLRESLQRDAEIPCFDETLSKLEGLKSRMVQFTAHRGDLISNLRLSLRDLNLNMRQNYANMIENTGKNSLPLMVVTDGEPDYFGVGGVFKVYLRDGTSKRIVPVGKKFEMHKALSHIVLGVFSIISPYFFSPVSINWVGALTQFNQNCKNVQFLMKRSEAGAERTLALTMLRKAIAYMDNCIATSNVNMAGYQTFANDMAQHIEQSMTIAAAAHARDTIPALQKLKEEMGEEQWRQLHVIIPTVWPVSLFNIRLQALEKVMSFEQIKEQVLIVEGARNEADAITTLGRVVADRAVAQLVWGGLPERTMQDHVISLSTRRDLLSSTATVELSKVCDKLEAQDVKPKCPFSGRSGGAAAGTVGTNTHSVYNGPATMLRH